MTPLKARAVGVLVAASSQRLEPDSWARYLDRMEAIGELLRFRADEGEAIRADHRCVCALCGLTYGEHPFSRHRSWDDQPFLHRLCGGELVKL